MYMWLPGSSVLLNDIIHFLYPRLKTQSIYDNIDIRTVHLQTLYQTEHTIGVKVT